MRICLGLFPQFSISVASPRCTIFLYTHFLVRDTLVVISKNNFYSGWRLFIFQTAADLCIYVYHGHRTPTMYSGYFTISFYFQHSEHKLKNGIYNWICFDLQHPGGRLWSGTTTWFWYISKLLEEMECLWCLLLLVIRHFISSVQNKAPSYIYIYIVFYRPHDVIYFLQP